MKAAGTSSGIARSNRGVQDWDRTNILNVTLIYELPFGRERQYGADWSTPMDAVFGGWQFNATHTVQSGHTVQCRATPTAGRIATPGRAGRISSAIRKGDKTRDKWFNTTPIGASGSAFGDRPSGPLVTWNATRYEGRTTAAPTPRSSSTSASAAASDVEIRIEAVNLFNVVNLGNPNAEVGTSPAHAPTRAVISSTAYFGADPQRNLQFAAKFSF